MADTFVEAMSIDKAKKSFIDTEVSEEQAQAILDASEGALREPRRLCGRRR